MCFFYIKKWVLIKKECLWFMWEIKFVKEGLIFDDVLFVLVKLDVLLNDVDLSVEMVLLFKLNVLIWSVGMDIIIEVKMVIVIVC